MNKVYTTLVALVLVAGLVAAAYFVWGNPFDKNEPQTQRQPELKKLSDGVVVSPVNSYDNDAIWYGTTNGRMMWRNLNTGAQTEYPLPQVLGESFKKIYWPKQGNDFIAMSELDGQNQFSYFNYAQKKYFALPRNVVGLDWMSSSEQIAIIWKSGNGKTYLVTSSPDASGYKIIRELPWSDMLIDASPAGDKALLMRPLIASENINKIYLFDLVTGEYSEEVAEGRNSSVAWSPKGDRFAFTRLVGSRTEIFIHDLLNGEDTAMDIGAGVGKMAFSVDGDKLYVAGLTSDASKEEIWEVNLVTLDRQVVFSSDTLRVKNIIVIGQKLYFLDQNDILYGYE
jgi:WD40 repeat protein